MAMTPCEIGLTVAVAVLAVIVLGMFAQSSPSCRSMMRMCGLAPVSASLDAATPIGAGDNEIVTDEAPMFGQAATAHSVHALQSAIAPAPDDIDGAGDVRAGLGMIGDGPTGAMGVAPTELYSHARNLIPASADDTGMYNAASFTAIEPGQSATGVIYPTFTIGATPEGSLTADQVLRDRGEATVRPSRETCAQICNGTYPHEIPARFEAFCNC